MDKLHVGLSGACLVAVAVAAHALVANIGWQRRADNALKSARVLQSSVDSLKDVASKAEASAAHKDTVRVTLTKLIPQTDSASHPDSTCKPSLAARDAVIASDSSELFTWKRAFTNEETALTRLQAENDTLKTALRTKPAVVLELFHPSAHVSLQLMLYPEVRLGVGVSLNVLKVPL